VGAWFASVDGGPEATDPGRRGDDEVVSSRFVFAQLGGWLVFVALAFWGMVSMANITAMPRFREILASSAVWAVSGFVVSSALARGYLFVIERGSLATGVAVVAGSAVGAFVWSTITLAAEWALGMRSISSDPGALVGAAVSASGKSALILATWSGIFLSVVLSRRMAFERERRAHADALAHRAQVALLQAQLNPHFLFNALNSVVALIDIDPGRAQQLVRDLGALLRRALRVTSAPASTIGEELDFAELYLGCEKVRFEEHLQVEWQVDADVRPVAIPPMLLQPLVENAVRHGGNGDDEPVKIRVGCHRIGERVILEVANTGTLTPRARLHEPLGGNGIGLHNVQQRLEAAYARDHAFALHEDGGWVHVRIAIPAAREGVSA
jgi:two-component system sensor histidine kinase AlgZ